MSVAEFRLRDAYVIILRMSNGILSYDYLPIEDAIDYLEKGLDMRVIPVKSRI